MKKQILITAGIAGMLIGNAPSDAKADVNLHLGIGNRPSLSIDVWPNFIYVPELGFSVSTGSEWDILSYDNYYYVHRDGYWYRSSHQRGPWAIVHYDRLPYKLRSHNWTEIRNYRDYEYRRHHSDYWFDQSQRFDFIYVPELGFSVSIGSPWDILFYDNYYYAYRNGMWYRSSNYRGPWVSHNHSRMPHNILRRNWGDIRKYRDFEYRKHNDKRWDDRRFDDRNRFDGDRKLDDRSRFDGDRKFDDKGRFGGDRKLDDKGRFDGDRKLDDRSRFDGDRKLDDKRRFGGDRKLDDKGRFGGDRKLDDKGRFDGDRKFDDKGNNEKGGNRDNVEGRNNDDRNRDGENKGGRENGRR